MKKILTDVWFTAAVIMIIVAALAMTGCTTSPGAPKGAVAWCGGFDYTGKLSNA